MNDARWLAGPFLPPSEYEPWWLRKMKAAQGPFERFQFALPQDDPLVRLIHQLLRGETTMGSGWIHGLDVFTEEG